MLATKGYLNTIRVFEFIKNKKIQRAKSLNNIFIELNDNGDIVYSDTKEKVELSNYFYKLRWEVVE